MEEKDSKTMISVKHLSKKFGDVTVLKDINLDIKEKEVVRDYRTVRKRPKVRFCAV